MGLCEDAKLSKEEIIIAVEDVMVNPKKFLRSNLFDFYFFTT